MEKGRILDVQHAYTKEMIVQVLPQHIRELYNVRPNIIKDGSKKLCSHSPSNFIGTALLELHKAQFVDCYERNGFSVPQKLQRPLEICKDISLYVHTQGNNYGELGLTAPQVLYKYGMGEFAGVITQGAYTGVLLTPINPDNPNEGMSVARIWNDINASHLNAKKPYGYVQHLEDFSFEEIRVATDIQKLTEQYYDELSFATPEGRWTGEMFIELCDQLQIPVDVDQFTMLRHP